MEDKEIYFDGGFSKINGEVLDLRKDLMSNKTKFIYAILCYIDTEGISLPTFDNFKNAFGIDQRELSKAINILNNLGYIKKHIVSIGGYKNIIKVSVLNKESWYILHPKCLIITKTLSVTHRQFLLCCLDFFREQKGKLNYSLEYTKYLIAKKVKRYGYSERTAFRILSELSDPKNGFLPIFTKTKGGSIKVNVDVLKAIDEFELRSLFSLAFLNQRYVYEAPKKDQYYFEDDVIVKNF